MKKIASDIYVSTEYHGVNVGFIAMPEGIIAIDAPTLPGDARAWRQQIMETTGGPILYLVLTNGHPDRLLSAGLLETPIVAARQVYEHASAHTNGFWRGIIDGWARRYPEAIDDLAEAKAALPEIMFSSSLTLHKGGNDMSIQSVPGNAPGSAWIYLQDQDVLFAGDTLVVDEHPFMETTPDTKAWLDTLTMLRRPRFSNTTIVPGRGPLCDQSASRPLSDYIALARRRVRSLSASGQPRVDTTALVSELLPLFPISEQERDLIQRRIKAGMERLYEELHLADL
jgi:glyoxylase-like metal-dependent hydrolase (beta-lactamase superfamily II)